MHALFVGDGSLSYFAVPALSPDVDRHDQDETCDEKARDELHGCAARKGKAAPLPGGACSDADCRSLEVDLVDAPVDARNARQFAAVIRADLDLDDRFKLVVHGRKRGRIGGAVERQVTRFSRIAR